MDVETFGVQLAGVETEPPLSWNTTSRLRPSTIEMGNAAAWPPC